MASGSSFSPIFGPNIFHLVSIKLDRSNYVLWLAQFLPVLKSNNMFGFVDGTKPCPAQYKLGEDGKPSNIIDPAYLEWQQKDQVLLSWINATLTPSVLSTVARFSTSQDVWRSLEKRYASPSRTRIMQLKNQIQTTKRGQPIDDDDFITLILNGVGPAYEATVNSAQAKDNPISLDDLVGQLLCAEMRVEEKNSSFVDSRNSALFTPKLKQNNEGKSTGSSNSLKNDKHLEPQGLLQINGHIKPTIVHPVRSVGVQVILQLIAITEWTMLMKDGFLQRNLHQWWHHLELRRTITHGLLIVAPPLISPQA